jgi:hypothetical protein
VRRVYPLGQALDDGDELGGELAGGPEGIPLTGIEPVVAAPGAEHHRGMLKKVAVDGDLHALDGEGGGLQPGRVRVAALLAGSPLAQTEDVGHDPGPFLPECLRGQTDRAQEIRLLRELRPHTRVLFVCGVVRVGALRRRRLLRQSAIAGGILVEVNVVDNSSVW